MSPADRAQSTAAWGSTPRFPERERPSRSLTDADVEAIAAAVADRLGALAAPRLLDARGLAEVLGVEASWVREHADRLGALRLGEGPRPRLRFHPERALEAAARLRSERSLPPDPPPPRRSRRRRAPSSSSSAPLLPIKGRVDGR